VARTFHPPTDPRKRSSSQAGLATRDDAQQQAAVDSSSSEDRPPPQNIEGGSNDALSAHIEAKRKANTLAARRTRQRKAEHAERMKEEIERLVKMNEQLEEEKTNWQFKAESAEQRAMRAEQALRQLGFNL